MAFSSKFEPSELPNVNIADFVIEKIKHFGNKVAVIEPKTERKVTYNEMVANIQCFARGLVDIGVKEGDVLLMCTTNCLEYYYVFYGVALTGAILTTANPLLSPSEISVQVNDSGATRIIVSAPAISTITAFMELQNNVTDVFLVGESNENHNFKSFESIMSMGATSQSEVNLKESNALDMPFLLPYSSGTSGLPKGVQQTNKFFVAQALQLSHPDLQHLQYDDISVQFLPMYHAYALDTIVVFSLWMGTTIIIMGRFDLKTYLDLLSKYKATVSHIVPPIAVLLAKSPIVDNYNLTSLRTLMSAAAPLSEDVMVEVANRLHIKDFRQTYGMTEIGLVTMSPLTGSKRSSVGLIVPNTDVKIVCQTSGALLGVNKVGEIQVRGPTLLTGYLKMASLHPEMMDDEGFFKTGDIGYCDQDGHFFITDRIKELIKYKGYQVAPAELEELLLTHPAIADAAVIGIPDTEAGELPAAYVVLNAGSDVGPEDIRQFVTEQVAPQKKLRGGVRFTDKIPKSAAGKILRRILRDEIRKEMSK